MDVEQVMELLRAQADPARLEGMARYAIRTESRYGLSMVDLRRLAKELPKDHALALDLWRTGNAEARILASMLAEVEPASSAQLDEWAADFDSWDVCDQVCDNLFMHTRFAWDKVREWSKREEEYVRRAAFALLACLAWHDKSARDAQFIESFTLIKGCANDGRNFVKKAVNWALRNIGKRNMMLNAAAITCAQVMLESGERTAGWIARDALRELQGAKMQQRLAAKESRQIVKESGRISPRRA